MRTSPSEPTTPALASHEGPSEDISVELLTRVLDEIERGKRRQWLDILLAVVISLAALGSAWCAYQSSRWNGAQLGLIGESEFQVVEATRELLSDQQWRTVDLIMLLQVLEAMGRGDEKGAAAIRSRFRPEARAAVEEWIKADPLNNPAAPAQPFMSNAAYREAAGAKARELQMGAERTKAAARDAGNNGDRYTLLALLFAMVMFMGGITGTFDSRTVRRMLAAVATLLFVGTAFALVLAPVCGV